MNKKISNDTHWLNKQSNIIVRIVYNVFIAIYRETCTGLNQSVRHGWNWNGNILKLYLKNKIIHNYKIYLRFSGWKPVWKTQKFRGSIDITAFNRWLIVNWLYSKLDQFIAFNCVCVHGFSPEFALSFACGVTSVCISADTISYRRQ